MKTLKNTCCLLLICMPITFLHGQGQIIPKEGYSTQIGIMVVMLEDLKNTITEEVKALNQEQTDFLIDEKANSIGAMIMHLASTEAYYQVETLEGRTWTVEEAKRWGIAGELGHHSREDLKGKPIKYYLDLWDEVRKKTLEGLKAKDDEWFAADVDEGINNHWVWYHVLKHMANHMGQIALVKNRLPN
ncbi:MAG: DUF664 domain-containing protein [Bacteroidota bacterium]